MMFTGIDEYTYQRTVQEPTVLLWVACALVVLGFFAAVFGLIVLSAVWKRRVLRYTVATALVLVVGGTLFLMTQSTNPDLRVEVTEKKTFLVITGEPTWSEVVRDEDGYAREFLLRLDTADEWLLRFPRSDIDALIGRSGELSVQCSPGAEKLECRAHVSGPVKKSLFGMTPDEEE